MTREELDIITSRIMNDFQIDSEQLYDFRNACIRYGFEKAKDEELKVKEFSGVFIEVPVRKYESVEEVLKELDEEQDDKR